MNDKEILEEVYRRVVSIAKNGDANVPSQVRFKEFKEFIEREWQREDEIEVKLDKIEKKERGKKNEKDDHPLTKWDEGQQYFIDAGEMERHRGLEIGKDGTVKGLKGY